MTKEQELEEAIMLLQYIRFADGVTFFRRYEFWREEVVGLPKSELLKKYNLIEGDGKELIEERDQDV